MRLYGQAGYPTSKRVTSPIPGVPHLCVNRLLKIGKVPIAKVKLVVLKQRQRQIILHEHCINETCDNITVYWSYLIFSRTYHWKGIEAGKNQRDIDKIMSFIIPSPLNWTQKDVKNVLEPKFQVSLHAECSNLYI